MFKEFTILLLIGLPFVLGSVEFGMRAGMAIDKERASKPSPAAASPNPCPTMPDAGKPVKGE